MNRDARERLHEVIRRHRTSRSPLVHRVLDDVVDAIRLEQPALPLPTSQRATARDVAAVRETVLKGKRR